MTQVICVESGVLEMFKRNEDGTMCIKIMGNDGKVYIYDNLYESVTKPIFTIGDHLGRSSDLKLTIKEPFNK